MATLEERLDRKPNSRKYDLGTGTLPQKITKDEYIELVFGSKLESGQVLVLMYLAHRFNFKDKRSTTNSVRRASNDLKITTNTFIKYKKQLEELGWISVKKMMFNDPDQITLLIGSEIDELKWKEPSHKAAQLDYEEMKRAKEAGKSKSY
jgi:hypothetical protein